MPQAARRRLTALARFAAAALSAKARPSRREDCSMAMVSGLSGNEIFCMALKNYAPGEIVVGNSVNSMGFLGAVVSGFRNMPGGEIEPVTEAIEAGRLMAFNRMVEEAKREGAAGLT